MSPTLQAVASMRDHPGPETLFAGHAPTAEAQPATLGAAPRNPFLPLLLALLAIVSWLGFQAWLLDLDRQQLQAARAALVPTIDTAGQLRRSLDLLAADTQRLADAGNGNAKVLVEELRKRGITINAAINATSSAASSTGR